MLDFELFEHIEYARFFRTNDDEFGYFFELTTTSLDTVSFSVRDFFTVRGNVQHIQYAGLSAFREISEIPKRLNSYCLQDAAGGCAPGRHPARRPARPPPLIV